MEFNAFADLESIGFAVVGRLRHRRAQIADEVGGRGWVVWVDPDQHAVEGSRRVQGGKSALPVPVKARRRISGDRVGESAATFAGLLFLRGSNSGGGEDC